MWGVSSEAKETLENQNHKDPNEVEKPVSSTNSTNLSVTLKKKRRIVLLFCYGCRPSWIVGATSWPSICSGKVSTIINIYLESKIPASWALN